MKIPTLISHRGAAGLAPENTLVGVATAYAQGVEHIEVDVRRSGDGVLLLLHDSTLERTTNGRGSVATLSWERLRRLDAGTHFSTRFSDVGIPTLNSLCAYCKGKTITLVLELKTPSVYPDIEQDIVTLIRRHNMENRIFFISFDRKSLLKISRIMPRARLGQLCLYPLNVPNYLQNQVLGVFWLSALIDPTLIPRLRAKGYQVWVWTVNNPLLMRVLIKLGVDAISTDRPDIWNGLMLSSGRGKEVHE